ncbi:MAG TPA: BolA family protein [Alphaproteobacteria bacterium]|nr:BolA family protein [Alphaproteobacteria bacterium]
MGSSETGPVAQTIRIKLEQAFAPVLLSILDESHLHAGHAGHDRRGESHFAVAMRSAAFVGKSRIERQRMVYEVLDAEMKDRVHALRLSLLAPGEEGRG